jgi:hypothetical protein
MQEHEVRELMDRLLEAMDPALEYEARHEDYVVEFPQSGERMDRDGLRAMQDAYPDGPPTIRVRRLVGAGDLWVGESVVHYAGVRIEAIGHHHSGRAVLGLLADDLVGAVGLLEQVDHGPAVARGLAADDLVGRVEAG